MKKTNSMKKHGVSQAQDEQLQAQSQLPQMGRDGLIGCKQGKNKKEPG
jgi:hypothetical protein